jgi:hypothetical protein
VCIGRFLHHLHIFAYLLKELSLSELYFVHLVWNLCPLKFSFVISCSHLAVQHCGIGGIVSDRLRIAIIFNRKVFNYNLQLITTPLGWQTWQINGLITLAEVQKWRKKFSYGGWSSLIVNSISGPHSHKWDLYGKSLNIWSCL